MTLRTPAHLATLLVSTSGRWGKPPAGLVDLEAFFGHREPTAFKACPTAARTGAGVFPPLLRGQWSNLNVEDCKI